MEQTVMIHGLWHDMKRQNRDCDEFFDEITVKDTRVLLRAEPQNESDELAVAVTAKGVPAGYVALKDLEKVPLATGRYANPEYEYIVGYTTGVTGDHHSYEIRFNSDHGWNPRGLEEAGREWEEWSSQVIGPVSELSAERMIKTDLLMLQYLQRDRKLNTQDVLDWCSGLTRVARIPLWREGQQVIQELISTLSKSKNENITKAYKRLVGLLHELGTDRTRKYFLEEWWPRFCQSEDVIAFMRHHRTWDEEALKKDIEAMPGHIGDFIADRNWFLNRIYYMRIPLAQWKQLMLLMACYDSLHKKEEEIKVINNNLIIGPTTIYEK